MQPQRTHACTLARLPAWVHHLSLADPIAPCNDCSLQHSHCLRRRSGTFAATCRGLCPARSARLPHPRRSHRRLRGCPAPTDSPHAFHSPVSTTNTHHRGGIQRGVSADHKRHSRCLCHQFARPVLARARTAPARVVGCCLRWHKRRAACHRRRDRRARLRSANSRRGERRCRRGVRRGRGLRGDGRQCEGRARLRAGASMGAQGFAEEGSTGLGDFWASEALLSLVRCVSPHTRVHAGVHPAKRAVCHILLPHPLPLLQNADAPPDLAVDHRDFLLFIRVRASSRDRRHWQCTTFPLLFVLPLVLSRVRWELSAMRTLYPTRAHSLVSCSLNFHLLSGPLLILFPNPNPLLLSHPLQAAAGTPVGAPQAPPPAPSSALLPAGSPRAPSPATRPTHPAVSTTASLALSAAPAAAVATVGTGATVAPLAGGTDAAGTGAGAATGGAVAQGGVAAGVNSSQWARALRELEEYEEGMKRVEGRRETCGWGEGR